MGIKEDNLIPATVFGGIERCIRHVNEFALVEIVIGGQGADRADTDGNPIMPLPVEEIMVGDGLADSLGDVQGLFGSGLWKHEDKLLTAVACDYVVFPNRLPGDAGEFLEDKVTGLVAIGIVAPFKVVNIGQK